jgi:hypothetical protein
MILHPKDLRQIETTILNRLTLKSDIDHFRFYGDLARTPNFRVYADVVEDEDDDDGYVLVTIFDGQTISSQYRIPGDVIRSIASPTLFDALINVWFHSLGAQSIGGLS